MKINNDYMYNYAASRNDSKLENNNKYADSVSYFKNLCLNNSSMNLKMSNDFVNIKNRVTVCFSPKLIKNAAGGNSKAQDIINHTIESIPDAVAFVSAGLSDGRRANSISCKVDENGNVETFIDWQKPENCKKKPILDDADYKEKLKKRKMKLDKLRKSAVRSSNGYNRAVYDNALKQLNKGVLNKDI